MTTYTATPPPPPPADAATVKYQHTKRLASVIGAAAIGVMLLAFPAATVLGGNCNAEEAARSTAFLTYRTEMDKLRADRDAGRISDATYSSRSKAADSKRLPSLHALGTCNAKVSRKRATIGGAVAVVGGLLGAGSVALSLSARNSPAGRREREQKAAIRQRAAADAAAAARARYDEWDRAHGDAWRAQQAAQAQAQQSAPHAETETVDYDDWLADDNSVIDAEVVEDTPASEPSRPSSGWGSSRRIDFGDGS